MYIIKKYHFLILLIYSFFNFYFLLNKLYKIKNFILYIDIENKN